MLGGMRQLQGKELSWNNLLDADAARKLVALFDEPAVVDHQAQQSVRRRPRRRPRRRRTARALATDPVSAFGSIVALNRRADRAARRGDAPSCSSRCWSRRVTTSRGARGLRRQEEPARSRVPALRSSAPTASSCAPSTAASSPSTPTRRRDDPAAWTCPTRRQPTAEERRALAFAWDVARYVKSNAIVLANAEQTVGIGAGQMSRVDSCRLAIEKGAARRCAAPSPAPTPSSRSATASTCSRQAGVTAVVQPGGSKRDDEVIAAADEHGMAMLFTGTPPLPALSLLDVSAMTSKRPALVVLLGLALSSYAGSAAGLSAHGTDIAIDRRDIRGWLPRLP